MIYAFTKQVGQPLWGKVGRGTVINRTMDGDDAIEFFEKLEEIYGPVFNSFPYDEHFGQESGFPSFSDIKNWLLFRPGTRPLTVHMLAEFIAGEIHKRK
ncbi:hypothetical protein [Pyruvatibacter mobilis]|uniref:hypothetical protein n=1 Tax=Pyruvatibacter mobilis TaxID=1712261 RepID=UPI003BAA5F88